MSKHPIPRIERRWVGIGTAKEAALAAVVSSYFHEKEVYFPVFEFPSIDTPYTPSSDFGKDGYVGRAIGDRVAHQINNALARIQPEWILLLGLTDTEKGYLRALLPLERLITVDKIEQLPSEPPFTQAGSDSIRCNSSQLIEGLLLAKFSRKHLTIDEGAPALPSRNVHGGTGILIIENNGDVHDVAAVNFAFAVDADVVLVQPVDRMEVRLLPRQLRAWFKDGSVRDFEAVERPISERIKDIDFLQYKFATFFTVGLPYGLIIKNIIPCSHVLRELDCGVFIANNLIEEQRPLVFDSALLFSPQLFASEETDHILKILEDHNYSVKILLGKDATVKKLDNYGSYFPFDLMHICAHGGETDGYLTTQDFADRQAVQHKCEFYEIIGVEPAGNDKVKVTRKVIFKTFDGFPWGSKALKAIPHYVFEDMIKAIKSNKHDELVRVRADYPIALSCHIQCHDSIHQGLFHSLSGFGHPVVFNNTCSSSHELAVNFIDAGARSYVGTLWSVGNETARRAAIAFYQAIVRDGNLLAAFFEMNKAISNQKYSNVYILWGLHFSSVRTPSEKSDAKILNALVFNALGWLDKVGTTRDPEVRRNSLPIVKFLLREIVTSFAYKGVEKLEKIDPASLEDIEKAQPEGEDDFSRGVTELEIKTRLEDTDKPD